MFLFSHTPNQFETQKSPPHPIHPASPDGKREEKEENGTPSLQADS